MATTMRKETIDKQYEQYQAQYLKGLNQGSLLMQTGMNGYEKPTRMLSRAEFDMILGEKLKDMAPNDSRKYKQGEDIFYEFSSQYSKKQFSHFRKEVGTSLSWDAVNMKGAGYDELMKMLEGHTYMSGGKLVIRQDFFNAHIGAIMNLYFGIGGRIGDS